MNFPLSVDENLSLVPVSPAYREDIYQNFSSEVIRYLLVEHPPSDISETDAFITQAMEQMKKGTDLVWVIVENNSFCGCCGIHGIRTGTPHYGLWIRQSAQSKGIGSRVTKFMLKWAVANLDIDYIRYPVDENNLISRRLIEKITQTIHRRYKMGENKVLQVIEYRVYPENKAGDLP